MQAWDVVIVGGSIAGMRAAIAASDAGATVTVLSSSQPSSFNDDAVVSGIASSAGEVNSSEHATRNHPYCLEDVSKQIQPPAGALFLEKLLCLVPMLLSWLSCYKP